MHNILRLKKTFQSKKSSFHPVFPSLPTNSFVESRHLKKLIRQLEDILAYWKTDTRIGGALVSVRYTRIVAKSNRIRALLVNPTKSIRGARFEQTEDKSKYRHVFTHFVSLEDIEKTIFLLQTVDKIVSEQYQGKISDKDIEQINKTEWRTTTQISKSNFVQTIRDAYYVERFDIDRMKKDIYEESVITIYRTNKDTKQLLSDFGINIYDDRIINGTTLRLFPAEIKKLQDQASYLIAMSVTDFNKISFEDIEAEIGESQRDEIIPKPYREPIIGVFDTPFNESVYFNEWVEYHNMLGEIPVRDEDYRHGTAVSSILVDGPKGNPSLDDGCGRFRVRHFGVATKRGFSAFTLLRQLEQVIAENTDIKVWNLSLGSVLEINDNFISPVAAELDRLQNEYDVVFVVAGTNRPKSETKKNMRIGSPADSLNSIVVNSVDFKVKPASYTRVGPVLSFFHKPDLSYYGGDGNKISDKICVCSDNMGASYEAGTSFAAPWIARKLAYLIYIVGINREAAKALLIDSAAGWKNEISNRTGYGVVPCHIGDIIKTKNDEIRFFITGNINEYETYDYSLPVPVVKGKHPFFARATLVYFPCCNRDQGVDYTCTEMDFKFGRVTQTNGKIQIKDIKRNRQADEGLQVIYEQDARNDYRKWDNVKHFLDQITPRARERQAYNAGMWGINIKMKERTDEKKGVGLAFGIVVTLKEMHQVDRYDDFLKLCQSNGWFVQSIDAKASLDIYLRQEENIQFE